MKHEPANGFWCLRRLFLLLDEDRHQELRDRPDSVVTRSAWMCRRCPQDVRHAAWDVLQLDVGRPSTQGSAIDMDPLEIVPSQRGKHATEIGRASCRERVCQYV